MEIIVILLTIVVCVVASLAWYWHRQHQKYDHLPGPPRDSFWTGHLSSIKKVIADGGMVDDYFLQLSQSYGPVFRICVFYQTIVLVLDPECIKDVLVTGNHPKAKFVYRNLAQVFGVRFFGDGLETDCNQKRWIVQRMHLDPWFKPHNLRQFSADFNEYVDDLIGYMDKCADGQTEVGMEGLLHNVALFLICKVAFNFDLGKLEDSSHPFVNDMDLAASGFSKVLVNPFLALNPFQWKYCMSVRKAVASVRKYAKTLMTERRDTKTRGDYFPDDLLERIMSMPERNPSLITEAILLDNFTTCLAAGQETTASAVSFMIYLLGQCPDCYKKLQEEIDKTIGALSVITPAVLDNLPYLDMVLKETLRLYPVVKVSTRETAHDHSLKGHKLPKGTIMLVSFYATSRSDRNVKDPDKFVPERFDPDNPNRLDTYSSTPFSVGPHTCIGRKFAEMEAKLIMAKIIQAFDFELVPGQPMGAIDNATLRTAGGCKCFLRSRRIRSI